MRILRLASSLCRGGSGSSACLRSPRAAAKLEPGPVLRVTTWQSHHDQRGTAGRCLAGCPAAAVSGATEERSLAVLRQSPVTAAPTSGHTFYRRRIVPTVGKEANRFWAVAHRRRRRLRGILIIYLYFSPSLFPSHGMARGGDGATTA